MENPAFQNDKQDADEKITHRKSSIKGKLLYIYMHDNKNKRNTVIF